jgi:hypothetical protein
MGSFIDLTGQTFGKYTVVEKAGNEKRGGVRWLCKCECGTVRVVPAYSLRRGVSSCIKCINHKHGAASDSSPTKEYKAWLGAKARCTNPEHPAWSRYGGRGITICQRWADDFAAFLFDMGQCPPGLTLERKDNNGNYEPGNCVWATWEDQLSNRRNSVLMEFRGETKCSGTWAAQFGIKPGTLKGRLDAGWPLEKALTQKARKIEVRA